MFVVGLTHSVLGGEGALYTLSSVPSFKIKKPLTEAQNNPKSFIPLSSYCENYSPFHFILFRKSTPVSPITQVLKGEVL